MIKSVLSLSCSTFNKVRPSWLVDCNRFAKKLTSASVSCNPLVLNNLHVGDDGLAYRELWLNLRLWPLGQESSKCHGAHESCQRFLHTLAVRPFLLTEVAQACPGLPRGVKFDPSDQEILWHLLAKNSVGNKEPHPFEDEFIPTVNEDEGICYTHPQHLPGEYTHLAY
ncbi:hypothetical protein RHSIM_Rhsim09G0112400 [Rhododendron simsii]|uniref:NAC domain-containing protein n=1 Tax=Rhododendron simsii TaxID=118357 RepID=A0A834GIF8_RHOSS|nr:hypothetical protein RHSIM_Rhsim09G0112400 [Rhododendron simsii]